MKWQGKCPACGQWNTIVEHKVTSSSRSQSSSRSIVSSTSPNKARLMSSIDTNAETRFSTGMTELDRVLGGGAVLGSLILVGGAPGIGKSTLLLQLSANISISKKVLYVSGEESASQLKMRAMRLGISGEGMYVLSETSMDTILSTIEEVQPDVLIIDSHNASSFV